MKEFMQQTWEFIKHSLKKTSPIEPSDDKDLYVDTKPQDDKNTTTNEYLDTYDAKRKAELERNIEDTLTYFPENYQVETHLLEYARTLSPFSWPNEIFLQLLPEARKVVCSRKPLPAKEKYGYLLWQIFSNAWADLEEILPKHPRLEKIKEESLELSAAKADILILSSGGDRFNKTIVKLLTDQII
jgi:hypothetical protein